MNKTFRVHVYKLQAMEIVVTADNEDQARSIVTAGAFTKQDIVESNDGGLLVDEVNQF